MWLFQLQSGDTLSFSLLLTVIEKKKNDTTQKINVEQPMTYFFRLTKIKITEIEFEFGTVEKFNTNRKIGWKKELTLQVNRKTEEPHEKNENNFFFILQTF